MAGAGRRAEWNDAKKVSVTFAVESLPPIWLEALPEGGKLVAPVGPKGADQRQNRDDEHHWAAPFKPERLVAASVAVLYRTTRGIRYRKVPMQQICAHDR